MPGDHGTLVARYTAATAYGSDGASLGTITDEAGSLTLTAPSASRNPTYRVGPPALIEFNQDWAQASVTTPLDRLHRTTAQGGGGGTVMCLMRWDEWDQDVLQYVMATRQAATIGAGVLISLDGRFGTEAIARIVVGTGTLTFDADQDLRGISGGWHTVGFVADPDNGEFYMLFDGALLGPVRTLTPSASASEEPLVLGNEIRDIASSGFVGDIREVVVYEDVLTLGEVYSLHTALMTEVA